MSKSRKRKRPTISPQNKALVDELVRISGMTADEMLKEIQEDDSPSFEDIIGLAPSGNPGFVDNAGFSVDDQDPEEFLAMLVRIIKRTKPTVNELALAFNVSVEHIHSALNALQSRGANLRMYGDNITLLSRLDTDNTSFGKVAPYESRNDNSYKFGIISDTHLCSKYQRMDVLNYIYNIFEKEGVDRVFHAGNWIDGENDRNKGDIFVHGMESQLEYFVDNYPQRKGITTYAVTGDDHEGWYAKQGIDIGRLAEYYMREKGREDWVNLGYMEAFVPLVNKNTSVQSTLLVAHPGGGSTYAISHRPQKLIDAMDDSERPDVAVWGHLHKMNCMEYRGVISVQAGCTQDQSPFMRKIPTIPSIGGIVMTLHQDKLTGHIGRYVYDAIQCKSLGKCNNRWNPASHPATACRTF